MRSYTIWDTRIWISASIPKACMWRVRHTRRCNNTPDSEKPHTRSYTRCGPRPVTHSGTLGSGPQGTRWIRTYPNRHWGPQLKADCNRQRDSHRKNPGYPTRLWTPPMWRVGLPRRRCIGFGWSHNPLWCSYPVGCSGQNCIRFGPRIFRTNWVGHGSSVTHRVEAQTRLSPIRSCLHWPKSRATQCNHTCWLE